MHITIEVEKEHPMSIDLVSKSMNLSLSSLSTKNEDLTIEVSTARSES